MKYLRALFGNNQQHCFMHSLEHSMNHEFFCDDLQRQSSSFYTSPSLPQLSSSTSHQEDATTYWINSAVLQGPPSTMSPHDPPLYMGALPQLFPQAFTPPSYYFTTSHIFAGYNSAGPTFPYDLYSAPLDIGCSSTPSIGTSSVPLSSTIPSRSAPTPPAPDSLLGDTTVSDLFQTAAPSLPQQRETEILIGEK